MRKYSFIYGKLVTEDGDLIGLLAYSIYKKQKIEHIQNFVDQHGCDPNDAELDTFHQFTIADSQIEQYKTTAESKLNDFVNEIMDIKAQEVEKFYKTTFRDIAKEKGHGFWYGILQGVVSSLFYTILLGAIFFISWSLQLGPVEVIEKVFHIQITRDTTSSQNRVVATG